jgi:hypothetical protein
MGLRDELRSDPVCRRDRLIDREIWQSSRLARSRNKLTQKAIARVYPPPRQSYIEVCQYVVPTYPEPRHG